MKNLLKFTTILGLVLAFSSCTTTSIEDLLLDNENESENSVLNPPCDNEDPKTRVINNGTVPFNLKVLSADGTAVVSIINIPPNTTTSWATFTEDELMFSLKGTNFDVPDDKVLIQMNNCMAYEIEVDANNEIVSYVPIVL